MIFYKSVSAGNDFIHIESAAPGPGSKGNLAKLICDRVAGAGADGVVFYNLRENGESADFEIFNRDGSQAELSGNGMAGLSALLFYLHKFENRVVLHTKVGTRRHELVERKENTFRLKIEIGEADFSRKDFFPFLQEDRVCYEHQGIMFHPVSVGNPHVVVIPEKEKSGREMISIGKMLENADIFPRKTNVEFVLKSPPDLSPGSSGANYRVFYYERGVGPTQSSATGSAAVFAVLQKLGEVQNRLTIGTPSEGLNVFGKKQIFIENFTKIVYKGICLNA
jgi:diaminopimelate epimerase